MEWMSGSCLHQNFYQKEKHKWKIKCNCCSTARNHEVYYRFGIWYIIIYLFIIPRIWGRCLLDFYIYFTCIWGLFTVHTQYREMNYRSSYYLKPHWNIIISGSATPITISLQFRQIGHLSWLPGINILLQTCEFGGKWGWHCVRYHFPILATQTSLSSHTLFGGSLCWCHCACWSQFLWLWRSFDARPTHLWACIDHL